MTQQTSEPGQKKPTRVFCLISRSAIFSLLLVAFGRLFLPAIGDVEPSRFAAVRAAGRSGAILEDSGRSEQP